MLQGFFFLFFKNKKNSVQMNFYAGENDSRHMEKRTTQIVSKGVIQFILKMPSVYVKRGHGKNNLMMLSMVHSDITMVTRL